MSIVKQKITRFCVWWLNMQLTRDPGLYEGYKSNIAMAVFDEFQKSDIMHHSGREEVHRICNKGAERFLAIWRSQP